MKGTRIAFIGLVVAGLAVVGGAAFLRYGPQVNISLAPNNASKPAITLAPATSNQANAASQSVVASQTEVATATVQALTAQTTTTQTASKLKPIWGANYKEDDGLGRFVCGAYAFGGYYGLQQIQMSGADIKKGFHLGIVPFQLSADYNASEKERTDMLKRGDIDCLLTTLDSVALNDPGIITALIDESAGADQVWVRDIKTLNDVKGKRIAFEASGPSEFFIYYLLQSVQLDPKTDVKLLPQATINDAIKLFNSDGADVVVGWEPTIFDAERSGGKLLISTKDFRPIVNVVVTGRKAMETKRNVADLFHDVWFDAIRDQGSDFEKSAKLIAQWGNNDYTGVKAESAADDLRALLLNVAQADIGNNYRGLVSAPSILIEKLRDARAVWAKVGYDVPKSDITQLVNAFFIEAWVREDGPDVKALNKLVNSTFSIGGLGDGAAAAPSATTAVTNTTQAVPTQQEILASAQAVATLPCSRFDFAPNTSSLVSQAQQDLRNCALKLLQDNPNLFVRVKGSSAWPGPKGSYTQPQVESTAKSRAEAIVNYLVSLGIRRERFLTEWTVPPLDRRETNDLAKQAQDRFVEITLLASGL